MVSEADEYDKQHQVTLNQVRDSQSLVTKTPWLRRRRWGDIFAGKDMSALVKLTEAPGIDNHQERHIWKATVKVIQNCFKGVIDCQERGWTLIPFWLRSVDRNKETTKPFRMFIAPYTLCRYASYWQQYISSAYERLWLKMQFSSMIDRRNVCGNLIRLHLKRMLIQKLRKRYLNYRFS